MARRAPALQQTVDGKAPVARLNGDTAARLGIADEQHAFHVFTLYGQQDGPPGNAIEF